VGVIVGGGGDFVPELDETSVTNLRSVGSRAASYPR
jgi:hypothetical protein